MDANDLADGFCEWVKQDEARDIDSPEFRDELARLFECIHAEARAETEARVVEAALSGIRETIDECEDEDYVAWDTLESVLVERIRALDSATGIDALTEMR